MESRAELSIIHNERNSIFAWNDTNMMILNTGIWYSSSSAWYSSDHRGMIDHIFSSTIFKEGGLISWSHLEISLIVWMRCNRTDPFDSGSTGCQAFHGLGCNWTRNLHEWYRQHCKIVLVLEDGIIFLLLNELKDLTPEKLDSGIEALRLDSKVLG